MRLRNLAVIALVPILFPAAAHAQCEWQPGFHVSDLDSIASALVVYDNGAGPHLYAGGFFLMANGARVNGIARWDGVGWNPVGGGFESSGGFGGIGKVWSFAVYNGELYAAGEFDSSDGAPVNGIARWGGSSWSAVGDGVTYGGNAGRVYSLVVYDDGGGPVLYVGGQFDTAGGAPANNIARWNGVAWSTLGAGVDDDLFALEVFDDGGGADLYAGGRFENAGGSPASRIARWDGAAWSTLGSGANATVRTLEVFDDGGGDALYAGGSLTEVGGVQVGRVARWDGSVWSALGGGVDAYVRVLFAYDDGGGEELFAGGLFENAGGAAAAGIARWDGSSWSEVGGGLDGAGSPSAFAVADDGGGSALFVGGDFAGAGGVPAGYIVRWRGGAWSALSPPSGSGIRADAVYEAIVLDDGTGDALYVGGWDMAGAGDQLVGNVARGQQHRAVGRQRLVPPRRRYQWLLVGPRGLGRRKRTVPLCRRLVRHGGRNHRRQPRLLERHKLGDPRQRHRRHGL